MGEVDFDAGVLRQLRMSRHFAPLVIGEGAAHSGIEALQDRSKAIRCCVRRAVIELHQGDMARLAFDQRAHLRAVAGPLDVIAFPMAGHQPFCNVGGAQIDAGHVGNLPAPVVAARTGPALAVPKAQQRNRVGAQLPFGHGVDRLVDGFVAQAHRFIHAPQCTGDLFG